MCIRIEDNTNLSQDDSNSRADLDCPLLAWFSNSFSNSLTDSHIYSISCTRFLSVSSRKILKAAESSPMTQAQGRTGSEPLSPFKIPP